MRASPVGQLRHREHGLPAAARDVADRELAGHRAAQLEHVGERVLGARVGAHAGAAARRPAARGVHADEHPGVQVGLVADGHLLAVPRGQQRFERGHVRDPIGTYPGRNRWPVPMSDRGPRGTVNPCS